MNKKREYLKDKINELTKNHKNKNIRDLYRRTIKFKKVYQPNSNLGKDDIGQISTTVSNRQKNYFPQLLNVHSVSDGRHIETHTDDP
jgi:hypothetical protein